MVNLDIQNFNWSERQSRLLDVSDRANYVEQESYYVAA